MLFYVNLSTTHIFIRWHLYGQKESPPPPVQCGVGDYTGSFYPLAVRLVLGLMQWGLGVLTQFITDFSGPILLEAPTFFSVEALYRLILCWLNYFYIF
jgi:hypothetical protein